ncbi:hypothetical protein Pyn_25065 [Prunus yedoensis var. nudiflora]|uniref:Uncharacterized protein n=1 Tax=Prunus yedoensis var. nudiflora TaxID=2094558 RepID=A0A315ADM7_PRUYE|nr:hypothetical protein Pyn_25065 [Prunus yedoensis var. nudiflora]
MWVRKARKAGVAIGAWDWAEPAVVAVVVDVVETGRIGGGVGFDIAGKGRGCGLRKGKSTEIGGEVN